jgi:hypothetical protein
MISHTAQFDEQDNPVQALCAPGITVYQKEDGCWAFGNLRVPDTLVTQRDGKRGMIFSVDIDLANLVCKPAEGTDDMARMTWRWFSSRFFRLWM